MKLHRLSPETDFNSKFQSQLDILIKNQLYSTHQLDKILKIMNQDQVDHDLQKQVDQYFEETPEPPAKDDLD